MAIPVAGILVTLGRALREALKRSQGLLAMTGLVVSSGFSINAMIRQVGETALSLWPLLAIACFFLLAKEVVKGWLQVRQRELDVAERDRK